MISMRTTRTPDNLDEVRALDMADPLRHFRARFSLPEDVVYLDGNSLGALPHASFARLTETVQAHWGQDLIRSWRIHGWVDAPQRVGDRIANLIGAAPGEVIVSDSTSANLYKLIHAALVSQPGRSVVLSEPGNFPTDLYAAEGAIRSLGGRHILRLASADQLMAAIDEDTAIVLLTHVHYKSAAIHDMRALSDAARGAGALTLWDLSHSVGVVEVNLNGVGADLAVGCGYKYLNGGPGAPAFLFIAQRHQQRMVNPLSGWMGHARAFDFVDHFEPAEGIRRFLCGTPQVLGIVALESGVQIVAEAGIVRLAEKSRSLCQLFIALVERRCSAFGFRLVGPTQPRDRGSHVAFSHPNGYPIVQALIARGVIGDFRAPDIVRFGIAPLYTRYEDVWLAVDALHEVLESELWREEQFSIRGAVS
jgi:kynureninase